MKFIDITDDDLDLISNGIGCIMDEGYWDTMEEDCAHADEAVRAIIEELDRQRAKLKRQHSDA